MSYIGNDLRTGRSEVFYYTSASGGETSITTATDGRSINYTVGWCAVYVNGIRLHDSDTTLTSGSSVVFASPLSQNDVVTVEAMHTFSVSDSVPATGGTFTGNVSFGDNNITNVGSVALDSISADGSSITISTDTALAAGVDIETSTTGKVKQKGAFMQNSVHQSWVMGG